MKKKCRRCKVPKKEKHFEENRKVCTECMAYQRKYKAKKKEDFYTMFIGQGYEYTND